MIVVRVWEKPLKKSNSHVCNNKSTLLILALRWQLAAPKEGQKAHF